MIMAESRVYQNWYLEPEDHFRKVSGSKCFPVAKTSGDTVRWVCTVTHSLQCWQL